jgi:hypothetical protein
VQGSWGLEPGGSPQVLLTVEAPTAIGYGRQTTALDVEHSADGRALLRLNPGAAFARRRDDAWEPDVRELEQASGYVGRLEILES